MEPQQVSISEAARLTGRARRSLYRDIKSGRLSVTMTHNGTHTVTVSELLRVYGAFSGVGETSNSAKTVPSAHRVISVGTTQKEQMAALKAENMQLREHLADLRERLLDKDKNLDDLRATIKLLEYKKQGFWSRIFRTKDHL